MNKYEVTVETFNKLASKYQDKYMNFDLYTATYDLFCSYIKDDNAHILELACGPGNVTKYLLAQRPHFNITGIDLAQNMIELARKNNPKANYHIMDC